MSPIAQALTDVDAVREKRRIYLRGLSHADLEKVPARLFGR